MDEKQKQKLKDRVFYAASVAMIGLIHGEASNPKGAELPAIADAACHQGLELVKAFHGKPFQVELEKQLSEL